MLLGISFLAITVFNLVFAVRNVRLIKKQERTILMLTGERDTARLDAYDAYAELDSKMPSHQLTEQSNRYR